jgi:hypothetical protein
VIAETTTWRVGDGWSSPVPAPGDGEAVLLVMCDDDTLVAAATAGLDPLGEVREAWAGRPVLGFSTAGHAVGERMSDGALVVTVLRFEHTRVRVATASFAGSGSARRAGRDVAHSLEDSDLRLVLFAAGGTAVNGSAVADGITDVVPGVEMVGVLAADGVRYERSWTLTDRGPVEGSVAAIGFLGDALEVTTAAGTAWQPLGPERLVTASHGNVVREIDGVAPAELYRDYLGVLADRPDQLVANCSMLPLEIRDLDDRRSVRSVTQVHADGSISVSGDVPQGAGARLLRAGVGDLVHDATVTAKTAREEDAEFCLTVSTAGRRRVLGERAEDEVLAVAHELPTGLPLVACWGYGTVIGNAGGVDVFDAAVCVATWREHAPVSPDRRHPGTHADGDHHSQDPRAEEG